MVSWRSTYRHFYLESTNKNERETIYWPASSMCISFEVYKLQLWRARGPLTCFCFHLESMNEYKKRIKCWPISSIGLENLIWSIKKEQWWCFRGPLTDFLISNKNIRDVQVIIFSEFKAISWHLLDVRLWNPLKVPLYVLQDNLPSLVVLFGVQQILQSSSS